MAYELRKRHFAGMQVIHEKIEGTLV